MENKVTIVLNESDWKSLIVNFTTLNIPYEIKKVQIDDTFLKDDKMYQTLKKRSIDAYKERENYLYDKFNNV